MFIETKRFTVKKGFSDEIVKKFSKKDPDKKIDGVVDFTIMKKLKSDETEEVMVEIRWENQEYFTNWKKSPDHKAGHANRPKERPEFILDVKMDLYNTI
ncbi:MAG: antibiotic biosynthesis monooxygenase [Peptostreptococcaceae bacterium]